MKTLFISMLIVCSSLTAYSQEIKMTEDARKKYVSKNESNTASESTERNSAPTTIASSLAYVALDVTSPIQQKGIRVRLDKGANARLSKLQSMDLSELENLEKGQVRLESDVDLLNHVASQGWQVVSIVDLQTREAGLRETRIYLMKAFSK
jgi:hypothetical protein